MNIYGQSAQYTKPGKAETIRKEIVKEQQAIEQQRKEVKIKSKIKIKKKVQPSVPAVKREINYSQNPLLLQDQEDKGPSKWFNRGF